MIRAFEEKDLTAIMQIWLDTNIKTQRLVKLVTHTAFTSLFNFSSTASI